MLHKKLLIFPFLPLSLTLVGCGNQIKQVISFREDLSTKYDNVVKEANTLGTDFTHNNDKFKRYRETIINNNDLWSKIKDSKDENVACSYYSLDKDWQILKTNKNIKKNECVKIFQKEFVDLDGYLPQVVEEMNLYRQSAFEEYENFMEKIVELFSTSLKGRYDRYKEEEKSATGLFSQLAYTIAIKAFETVINTNIIENMEATLTKIKNKDPLYVLYKEAKFVWNPFDRPDRRVFWKNDAIKAEWNKAIKTVEDAFKKVDELVK